ncbi:hypothetical protein JMJ77_0000447 [Colletotrichum scovillei]|uniref:Uncharacterized protein n=1 Tax=Colletotrichum scovillei TaxID=1209932 RepID=A0A9P7R9K6_9PEZI|nr:hypothetical protein JMJ77_0000447 [Colletotrichum scovillei]KAG7071652.1 hypothetical protein JMJ76_0004522 [Colletotrichum scovillei]KAG7079902.1 hypothetical protein JMJ78_0007005 [Colletotrichum scovillei]
MQDIDKVLVERRNRYCTRDGVRCTPNLAQQSIFPHQEHAENVRNSLRTR